MESIIGKALVCRLAMVDGDQPYVVPLCFGYRNNTLYFHSAPEGRKLDILKKNNRVCFEFDIDSNPEAAEKPCAWAMHYKSVIGFGRATFIEDTQSKRAALNIIFKQYAQAVQPYPEAALKETMIIKVKIEQMTGKKS